MAFLYAEYSLSVCLFLSAFLYTNDYVHMGYALV